jgi:hypothetical protein
MKNLEFLDYMYVFLDRNVPLIVGHVMSKFSYFWSKINPQNDSKIKPCAEPHCAKNYPEFTVPRVVRGPYVSRKHTSGPVFHPF